MSSLQTYLALIDPMLFTMLKSIRRTFEANGGGVEWAIGGNLAMYLYSYASRLSAVNPPVQSVDLRVKIAGVKDVSRLDGVLDELLKLGFQKVGKSELIYPLSSIRIVLRDVKDLDVVWIKNIKGKSTYPLLKPEIILDEKVDYIKKLPLVEKLVENEVHEWMKEVMNHLVIE